MQCGTTGESTRTELLDGRRQNDRLDTLATMERVSINDRDTFRQLHTRQRRTTVERILRNTIRHRLERDGLQTTAVLELTLTDTSIVQHYALETFATLESGLSERANRVRDHQLLQRAAVCERFLADMRQTVAQIHRNQTATVLERFVADDLQTLRRHERS